MPPGHSMPWLAAAAFFLPALPPPPLSPYLPTKLNAMLSARPQLFWLLLTLPGCQLQNESPKPKPSRIQAWCKKSSCGGKWSAPGGKSRPDCKPNQKERMILRIHQLWLGSIPSSNISNPANCCVPGQAHHPANQTWDRSGTVIASPHMVAHIQAGPLGTNAFFYAGRPMVSRPGDETPVAEPAWQLCPIEIPFCEQKLLEGWFGMLVPTQFSEEATSSHPLSRMLQRKMPDGDCLVLALGR